ncbi:hypothetical protein Tco_0687101 [Tanacetum coccineum]
MQTAHDRQKSYADEKHKPMDFQVGDKVMLKVSPWKGVVRFGKQGKLNPRYVGPFKVLEKVGAVAYKLELPQELSRVHNTIHVSNLKRCYSDDPLIVPLDGLHVDDKLYFVEEPVEIMDREVKQLRHSRVPIVKVRWNSKRGHEFTWEHEDQFKKKYPHLFMKTAPSSSTASRSVKTVNREVQLQALVDGKKIIITEVSVRCDLQLNDEEGTDCLPNATIFEELTRMGSRRPKRKDTEVPQPSGPTTNVADEAVNEEMDDSLVRAATTASSLEAEQDSGSGPRRQETMGDIIARTRVLDLGNTKTAQAQEITSLKLRVKKLEKKGGSRTHKFKRLYKLGRSARVISSDETSLGDQEDASKQGRKIDDIDKDA